jgi:hypothetical protein
MPSADSTCFESPQCAFSFLQDENKVNNRENKERSTAGFQINTLLNSNTPNSSTGEKTSAPQTEVGTTKDSSSNLSTEAKSVEFTAEASKESTDINKVPRIKDIPLSVVEEMSQRSISISEAELESLDSKNANRSKRETSEVKPHNSPTPQQLTTQNRPEIQVWTKSTLSSPALYL